MKKIKFIKRLLVFTVVALIVYSCGNNVAKINGNTITLLEDDITVIMKNFSSIQKSEESSEYDEWEVRVTCIPEITNAIALDQNRGAIYLTPIANVKGNNIIIEGVNGAGTCFSFKIPKGETPISYQIKIKDKVLTYDYDKKTWTYSVDDNDFKPAEAIRM